MTFGCRCTVKQTLTHSTVDSVPPEHSSPRRLSGAIAAKLDDGNKEQHSDCFVPTRNPDQFVKKLSTNPTAAAKQLLPDPSLTASLFVDEADVLKAVKSFPTGSSGGPDGVRPEHLADIFSQLSLVLLTRFWTAVATLK